MNIKIQLGNEWQGKLLQIERFLNQNKSQLLANIGTTLTSRINQQFVSESDPWGRVWQPLKSRNGQPLRDTGRLKGSINYQIQGDHVEVGTNVKYAPTHQFGATITPKQAKMLRFIVGGKAVFAKKVVIPARPYLPIRLDGSVDLPDSYRNAIQRNLQRFIEANI